jgi:cytochrome P450
MQRGSWGAIWRFSIASPRSRSAPRRGTDARRCFAAAVHLPYTVQVLKEALRLCPPGPHWNTNGNPPCRDRGYPVEAGTMLAYGRLAVQRDPTLWEEPLTFDPDRQLLRSLRVIVDVRNGVRR